jgi:PhnB protein
VLLSFALDQMEGTHMASTGTYLNFDRQTEEAFLFYRDVFGGEFEGNGIMRMGDMASDDGSPQMSEADKQLIMNVGLRITGNHLLMGTDSPESSGFSLTMGNNVYINLMPDTRAEADRLFNALSGGGRIESPMADMFWGDYWGSCVDKFGVHWMVNQTPAG